MQMSGRSWFGPGSLIADYTDFSWYMVANSPWIKTSELSRTPPPIGCIDSNVLGYASYYCGNWTLVALAVAFAFLSVCLVIIARRARTSTQKILAISGAIALIAQTVLGILHFFFLIPHRFALHKAQNHIRLGRNCMRKTESTLLASRYRERTFGCETM